MRRYSAASAIGLIIMTTHAGTHAQVSIKSPQGKVEVAVSVDPDGRLIYATRYAGRSVLAPSRIGVVVDG
ncbi:MAG TPA: glycoside hydrolase family 97 N-terminal domain-containing protein, partial [Phycisphaerae bacterium]|nr:glycoside hydrolase family 97 N-terminal domain-containing protein [Phycisphaerae bacterium]